MKSIHTCSPRAAVGVTVLAVVLGCLLCLPTPARAQGAMRYKSSPLGSKVKIDGTSNIHDWSMTGQLISGFLEVPAGVTLDPAQASLAGVTGGKLNARAEVFIAVSSLQSGTQGMDEVMQQAMKAADYPRIQFHLTEMVFKEPHTAGTPLKFDTKGDLMVAGITNKISMPVSIESAEKSKLKVVGSVPLKMTDFNVTPPVKLGLFKTTNEVTISFEWMLNPAKPAEAKGQ